jgi:hypothetical protein
VALGFAVLGALAAGAVMLLVALVSGGGDGGSQSRDGRVFTAPGKAFSISVPEGWKALRGAELAGVQGGPVAALSQTDGRGLVLVHRSAAVQGDLRAVARRLTTELRGRVLGFKLVSARLGRVRAGGALLYTFVRGKQAMVQTLALTKVRGVTYRIDAVVPGDQPDAAREAGAVVGSFGP